MSDTTGFDVNEKVNILFKTAMGFPSTKESTNWFQETNVPYNTYVFGSDILTDDIPANPTYGAAKTSASVGLTDSDFDTGGFVKDSTDGKVRYYHRLILDQCIANNNDSWHKKNSSGNNVLMDALQFNVQKTASNTPYGYVLTNKANVAADNTAPNEILQNAAGGNWFFDIKSGIVFFPDNSTPSLGVVDNNTKKPVFSFYKYIGNKGLSTWSGGGGGGGGGSTTLGGLTDVSTAGATSGQAIVYNGSSWAPGNVASGGGGGGQVTTSETQFANCILLKPKSNWSYTPTGGWHNTFQNLEIESSIGNVPVTISKAPTNIKTYIHTLTGYVHGSHDYVQGLSTNDSTITFNKSGLYRITMYTGPSTCHGISGGVAKLFTMMGYIFDKNNNPKYEITAADPSTCVGNSNPHLYKATKDDYAVFLQRRQDAGAVNYATDLNLRLNQGVDVEYIPETVQIGGNGEAVLDGQVLETLAGELDGRTVTVASGTYTLGNVTQRYDPVSPSSGFTAIPNCSINYKPPTGTKVLNYKIRIFAHQKDNVDCFIKFMLYVDGNPITASYEIFGTPSNIYQMQYITYSYQMQIGGTDDIPNGKFSNWNSNKLIEIRAMDAGATGDTNWEMYLHTSWIPGPEPGASVNTTDVKSLHRPKLEITAIGRGKSGVALVGKNMVTTTYTTLTTVTAPSTIPGGNISGLNLIIKPEYNDSVIELKFNIFCGVGNDVLFRITRNIDGTDVLVVPATDIWEGGLAVPRHQGYQSTPEVIRLRWYDEPNTTKSVTYKVWINSTQTGGTQTLYLNRTQGSATGASLYETGVSTAAAIEHPKPNKALNPITSAMQVEGQVLETLAGKADGSTITVSSGTYTMPISTIAVNTEIGTSYIKEPASEITYKAPTGTERIIFEFVGLYYYADAGAVINGKFYVDDVEYPGSGSYGHFKKRSGNSMMGQNYFPQMVITSQQYDLTVPHKYYWKIRSETSSHNFKYGYGGSGLFTENTQELKITAIGTADYDVVQRVVTYKDGQVLETLAGICDGRAITVSSGTYTLENVTASLSATTTFVDLTGSKINYKPPVGVKTVIYEFEFQHNYGSTTNGWGYYKFLLDGTQVGGTFELGFDDYGSGIFKVSFPFEIGENDLANGKILTWDTNKEIKIQFREHSSISQIEVHVAKNWKSLTSETGLIKPRIKITAIGQQVAPASAADFKIQKVDTISRLPNNGNMLTWDQAKGRWKPSEFIVANDDGTKNISDIMQHTGYEITASVNQIRGQNSHFHHNASSAFFGPQYGEHCWSANTGSKYYGDNGNGLYTGSTSTTTSSGNINGEWIQINFNKLVKAHHMMICSQPERTPKDFSVVGSLDGTTWTLVHDHNGTSDQYNDYNHMEMYQWNSSTNRSRLWNKITFSTPVTYQYLRLIVESQYPSKDQYVWIEDINYYGNFPNERIQTLPVSGVNMSYVNFKDFETVTVLNTSHTEIQGLRLSITPEYSDSVIELNYVVQLENTGGSGTRDMGAVLTRTINGVETIFRSNGGTDKWDTLQATAGYDGYAHHMYMMSIKYYDEPNTTEPIIYKIKLIHTGEQTNQIVYINRNEANTGGSTAETAISVASAKELPKPNTAVLSSVNNSTAVDGQVLETLSGVCDGRSVTVSSGTYTLPNVTAHQSLTSTYQVITGSTINYKPPTGTTQVVYSILLQISRDSVISSGGNYSGYSSKLYIDNVQYGAKHHVHLYDNIGWKRITFIIDIGTNDPSNGKIGDWTSNKVIELKAIEYDNTAEAKLHMSQHGDHYGASNSDILKPELTITAIGTQQYDVVQRVVTYKDAQVLEQLAGVCDGRSITSSSGTYTLENVTTSQDVTQTRTSATGSFINYKPPSGTKQVVYEYTFSSFSDDGDDHAVQCFLEIDGIECTNQRRMVAGWYSRNETSTLKFVINIGDTDDLANAKVSSWDVARQLKVIVRVHVEPNLTAKLHTAYEWTTGDGTGANSSTGRVTITASNESEYLFKPSLKITAIGRAVEPASAADFKIQKVDTLSPLNAPESGSLLMWDGGKNEWRASSSRMEDLDIRLLSDPTVHVGHELTASSIYNDSDEYYEPHHAFNYTQTQYYNSVWASTGNYNNGAYTGSTSTEGYNGEWIQINFKRKAKIYYYGVMAEKRLDVKRSPKSWRLYGSNNGSSWTQLDEQQDRLFDNWWSKNQSSEWPSGTTSQHTLVVWGLKLQKIELSQPASYQYFRMVINEINGTDTKVHLNFLGFYGVWPTQSLSTVVPSGSNMVHKRITNSFVYNNIAQVVTPANTVASATELTEFEIKINPEYSDSVIHAEWNIWHEGYENMVFRIVRFVNGVSTVFSNDDTTAESGYAVVKYDTETSSTPNQLMMDLYDEPNTTSEVTYKIYISNIYAGASHIVFNRAYNDAGFAASAPSSTGEKLVSTVKAIEHPKPQVILPNISNSTAVEGQVLETLSGVCDGRTVVGSSGRYTLENVSAVQIISSTTYIKANGSGISYKPPEGTKQVIISYATSIQARKSGWHDPILAVVAKIGGSFTTNHFQSFRPQGNAGMYPDLYKDFTFIIDIGSVATDDIANGKLASWDVLKDIEINMKSYDTGNSSAIIHSAMHEGGDRFSYSGLFIPPRLTITAIGTTYHSAVPRIVTKKSGQLLETIAGLCDGRSITSASGTYTLENITQGTLLDAASANFIDFPGSSINYKPPSGTKQVSYTFHFTTGRNTVDSSIGLKFFIDSTEVTAFKKYHGTDGDYGSSFHSVHFVIDVGSVSSDDIANGKLANWNTSKTLKLQATNQKTYYKVWINKSMYDLQQGDETSNGNSSDASTYVNKPVLKIQAFGESGTAAGGVITETGGKVGIGTTTMPGSAELHIGGTGKIRLGPTDTQGTYVDSTTPYQQTYGIYFTNWMHTRTDKIGAKIVSINRPAAVDGHLHQRTDLAFYVDNAYGGHANHEDLTVEAMRIVGNETGKPSIGIGTTSPSAPLHVGTNKSSNNIKITQLGSSQYPNHQTNIMHGGQHYDCYDTATPQAAGSTSNGLILYLNYYCGAGVRIAGGTSVTSDDRLKHNEKKIENALDIINKITAKKYFKSQKRYDENHNYELDNNGLPITEDDYKIETGFIAQEVMTVPELKYLVGEVEDKKGANGDITVRGRYVLRYNDLFCYNIAATQELHKKVITLETKNTELEKKVKELENKVKESEMKVNTVYNKNALLEAEISMIKNKIGL
jgi:hypothetical protein